MAHKQRVTILNDYPEFLDLMVDFLTEEGYEVTPIPKHQGAFEQIKQSRPDIVICDIVFETQTYGLAFIDMMYLDPETRKIPIIVCSTATRHMKEIRASLAARGIRWLEKPFEIEQLLAMLKEVL
jgi:Response regulator containing CheY-like receiver, AAA-type ATPase, and DNA-binding domains